MYIAFCENCRTKQEAWITGELTVFERARNPQPYLFASHCLQLGKAIASISRGRKAVVAALKRTRYKEMRRSALEAKNPAKATGLPVSFHLRDLLGLGMIRELDTPSGAFLRLAPEAS